MDFTTLFRVKENLNLDKNTLTILRYIAIFGQFFAINIVYFYLSLPFPIELSYFVIFIGLLTNLYLQFGIKINQLKDIYASIFLVYDLIQLSVLLYLTGGIFNPFCFLLIIPAIVSSTFLSMGTTIILGFITSFLLLMLSFYHLPLPGEDMNLLHFPDFYKIGIVISIFIGIIFLLVPLIYLELGQAAAAAHSLGTPLATISVVAKELKKEIGNDKEYSKDIDLLISQTRRCSDILKQISKKQIEEDIFLSSIKFEDLLEEIVNSFKETSSKKIELFTQDDENKITIDRSPEIIYGLRNFIGNAVKFSKSNVKIYLKSNDKEIAVNIIDNGPGFPDDIFNFLGEPYIKSKSKETSSNAGLGLGTFLGKTLLERQGAKLSFKNNQNGAEVKIVFALSKLIN